MRTVYIRPIVLLSLALLSGAALAQESQLRGKHVYVWTFAENGCPATWLADILTEKFETALMTTGDYVVLPRRKWQGAEQEGNVMLNVFPDSSRQVLMTKGTEIIFRGDVSRIIHAGQSGFRVQVAATDLKTNQVISRREVALSEQEIAEPRRRIDKMDDLVQAFTLQKDFDRASFSSISANVRRGKVGGYVTVVMEMKQGERYTIDATGKIKLGPILGQSGPGGTTGVFGFSLEPYNLLSQYKHASLLYRLPWIKEWQYCGKQCSFEVPQSGAFKLEFQVNDNQQIDNDGDYEVEISRSR